MVGQFSGWKRFGLRKCCLGSLWLLDYSAVHLIDGLWRRRSCILGYAEMALFTPTITCHWFAFLRQLQSRAFQESWSGSGFFESTRHCLDLTKCWPNHTQTWCDQKCEMWCPDQKIFCSCQLIKGHEKFMVIAFRKTRWDQVSWGCSCSISVQRKEKHGLKHSTMQWKN